MTCALLTIGTELTRGDLHNTNAGWLAERLTTLGYEVTHMLSIDDDDKRICEALTRLSHDHDLIITTGGLGPTTDDRTSACVARVLGVPLVRDSASLAWIAQRFAKYGRVMSPSNEKQADFPKGANILANGLGTAPGFCVQLGHALSFFLPGVPREMSAMFEQQVVSKLPARATPFTTVRLRTFGMSEAEVNDRLAGLEEKHGVTMGYRASHAEIEVKVLAQGRAGETVHTLEQRANAVGDEIAERLGRVVYSRGTAGLPEVIGQLLIEQGASLGLAESCTGGLVSQWITQVPGASQYYKGGIVGYANTAKSQILGVSELLLNKYGAVSEPVARAMAQGAARSFGTKYALSITGIAGPSGGTTDKPVGLVHWAVNSPQGTLSKERVFLGERSQVQQRAATAALFTLYQVLKGEVEPVAAPLSGR